MKIDIGSLVKIYQDPITCNLYEGNAIICAIHSIDPIECLADATVLFHNDSTDAKCRRTLNFISSKNWIPDLGVAK